MPATLKLTHKAIGAEVRRGTYDVVVDGERVGRNEPHDRDTTRAWTSHPASSQWTKLEQHSTFDAAEEEIVAFRCTGKRLLPIFLASFAVPGLALKLVRD